MAQPMAQEMSQLITKLGTEAKVLRSPKQFGELLYDKWKLPCSRFTEKGARATDKAALTYLADIDDRMLDLLRWRELNTQYTKFIEGIRKCREYLGSDITHPSPKLFSTYTGRFTYASKSGQKGEAAKAKIGLPIHQWPRNKELRGLIKV
jgi:DNA polymerase I-like protein with 3'-5' exonuclease and polymerase domains